MSEKEFLEEEKDCAEMLGMSIEEYRKDLKNIKIIQKKDVYYDNVEYDNSFLNFLGFDKSILKKSCIKG